jgi:CO dehydrogenase maturation factor
VLESDILGKAVFAENSQLMSEVRKIKNSLEDCTKGK